MRCTALQALPLGDEIGDVCRILAVILVPAAVQKLPVVPDRDDSYKNDHVSTLGQMLRQRLVVVPCRFDAENDRRQSVLNFYAFNRSEQLLKPFMCVVKDETLNQRLAPRCAEECIVSLFRCINADNQILL